MNMAYFLNDWPDSLRTPRATPGSFWLHRDCARHRFEIRSVKRSCARNRIFRKKALSLNERLNPRSYQPLKLGASNCEPLLGILNDLVIFFLRDHAALHRTLQQESHGRIHTFHKHVLAVLLHQFAGPRRQALGTNSRTAPHIPASLESMTFPSPTEVGMKMRTDRHRVFMDAFPCSFLTIYT